MGRTLRVDVGNEIFHVINRANGRATIFKTDHDYRAFEALLEEAREKISMRILAYEIMPNHWHLLLYRVNEGDLSSFMQWLTLTHTQRWHVYHNTVGNGHLYQGRYKSFLIQKDNYFLAAIRYIERNALRAGFVKNAQEVVLIKESITRSRPFGDIKWIEKIINKFSLETTQRPKGRPRKVEKSV